MLVQAGLQTSTQSADLAGASAQGAKIGMELGQTILNAQNQRAQLEQKKEELEFSKQAKLLDRVDIGLTKVPKKAQASFFKALQNEAGALKMGISDDFVNAITSPDINKGALAQDLADYRLAYRQALSTGDFTKVREIAPKVLEAFGGNVEHFGNYISSAMSSETAARAQVLAAGRKDEQFNVNQYQKVKDDFTAAIKPSKEAIAAGDEALALLKTNEPVAAESIKTKIARLAGETGILTDKDITRYGGSQDLWSRAQTEMTKLTTGDVSPATRAGYLKLIKELQNVARKKIAAEMESQIGSATALGLDANRTRKVLSSSALSAGADDKPKKKFKELSPAVQASAVKQAAKALNISEEDARKRLEAQ